VPAAAAPGDAAAGLPEAISSTTGGAESPAMGDAHLDDEEVDREADVQVSVPGEELAD
jgi:hypothetical protein